MWHEARKSEKKVHDLMDAARRRAQRRAVFLAKRRGDPQQSLQIVGSRCRVHRDDGLYQAAQDQQGLIPWNGKEDVLIDRFDGRALLDFIHEPGSRPFRVQEKSEEEEELEQFVNFERYRDLIKHRRRGFTDEEGLQHVYQELEAKTAMSFIHNRPYTAQLPTSKGAYSQVGFSYKGNGNEDTQLLNSEEEEEEEEEEEDDDDKDFSSGDSNDEGMETIAKEFGIKRYNWLVYMDKKGKEEEKRQKEVIKGDPAIRKLSRKERRKMSQMDRERERESARTIGRAPYHDPYRESRRSPTYEAYPRSRRSRSRSRSYSPSRAKRHDRGVHSDNGSRSKSKSSKIEYITEFGGSADVDDQKLERFSPPSSPLHVDILNRSSGGHILERLPILAKFFHRNPKAKSFVPYPYTLTWENLSSSYLNSPLRAISSSICPSAARNSSAPNPDGLVVLGIETSCDDTAAAVVRGNGQILSQVVSSQAELLSRYGGVAPKMAEEAHSLVIDQVVKQALDGANLKENNLSAVAVTIGPGLSLCLRVGVQKARSIAGAFNLPIIGVHHMEAHALVARLMDRDLRFPFLALLISGGHNLLILAQGLGHYVQLGTTIDDAIGEAYDKTARWLGLDMGKGGGPALEELALEGDANSVKFKIPMRQHKDCNFSYAGLKTQVRLAIESRNICIDKSPISLATCHDRRMRADIAASFQQVAVLHLEDRCARAIEWALEIEPTVQCLVVSGGVASNKYVRSRLNHLVVKTGLRLVCPPPSLCTDNGVMVAWTGIENFLVGRYDPPPPVNEPEDYMYDLRPRWPLGEEYLRGKSEARSLKRARMHPSLTSIVQGYVERDV